MTLTWEQWEQLVDRINVSYPHQQIEPPTALSWFRKLKDYRAEEIDRALVRCLGAAEFISCYALVEAINADRRAGVIGRSTVTPLPPKGMPMPPETREAIAVLRRSTLLPDHPDYLPAAEARKRVEELAGYLDARLAEGSTAPMREQPA